MAPVAKPPVLVMVKLSDFGTPRSTELLRLSGASVSTGFSSCTFTLRSACMVTPSVVVTVSTNEPVPENPAAAVTVIGTCISSPRSRIVSGTAGVMVSPDGVLPTVRVMPLSGRVLGLRSVATVTTD